MTVFVDAPTTAAALGALPALAERFLPALADVTVKATLVLAAAHAVTAWGMRRAAAATRHLVWSGAVAAVLLLPVLAAVAPPWSAPVLPERAVRTAAGIAAAFRPAQPPAPRATPGPADAGAPADPPAPPAAVPNAAPNTAPNTTRSVAPNAPSASPVVASGASPNGTPNATPGAAVRAAAARDAGPSGGPALAVWAAGAWAAGALVVLARLALGTLGLVRLVRRARPADDPSWVMPMQRLARQLGVRRPVTLLVGRTGTVPVTWGVVYPVVLLPADAAGWSAERRRLVLLHELAHVERLDALTQTLAQLARAVFWFHPLAALAARRLRAERERACDDLVLAAGARASTYADDLLALVRTLGDASPAAAALAMARRSEFEGRLLAILDPRVPRARTSARRALAAAALAAVVAVPLAGMRPVPAVAPAVASAPPAAAAHRQLADRPADAPPSAGGAVAGVAGRVAGPQAGVGTGVAGVAGVAVDRLPVLRQPAAVTGVTTGALGAALPRLTLALPAPARVTPSLAAAVRPAADTGLDGAALADLARAARDIPSDGDRAAVLVKLAPRALAAAEARGAFYEAVGPFTGDGDRRRVLLAAVAATPAPYQLAPALDAVGPMTADGDRIAVLGAVAARRPFEHAAVRTRYFALVDATASEAARARALVATLAAAPPCDEALRAVLAAAPRFASDARRAEVLLAVAARTDALRRPATRAAFLAALTGMTSSAEYRRVMDAVTATTARRTVSY